MIKSSKEIEYRKIRLLRKNSKAESKFASMLNKANIFYIQEKCCYDNGKNWCYIDFYLPKFKLGIELDGPEHNYGKRKWMDERKTEFLKSKRNISTIRYTNDEVMKMDFISIVGIAKKAGIVRNENSSLIQFEKRNAEEMIKRFSGKLPIDPSKRIWLYDKDKDAKFHFGNIYVLRKSIGVDTKFIVSAIENIDDIHKSQHYIYSDSEKELDEKIEKYYDYLWMRKYSIGCINGI